MANTVIKTGLRADIMRTQMETKNSLTTKGSIYVGTGNKTTIAGEDCYQTDRLNPSSTKGVPLVSKGLSSGNYQGVEYAPVSSDGIGAQTVIGAAGTNASLESNTTNSKIYPSSISTSDICNKAVTNNKLKYNCIQIGDHVYQLSYGDGEYSSTALSNGESVTGLALVDATEVKGSIVTATNYFNASSDERLKENIIEYKPKGSILDVPVKEFDYKESGAHTIGFIAQDLQKEFPELVLEDKEGYLSIQETKLVYLLLLEVKKLRKKIDELEG